jgi:transcription termination factor Rho
MSEKRSGVLKCLPKGGGFLRDVKLSFQPGPDDVWVSQKIIREYGLKDGAAVSGMATRREKGYQLDSVESICGMRPDRFKNRERFEKLAAINPMERIRLGNSGNVSMRIMELVAPVGKGTRGLIVASPKSGKTQFLENIANAVTEIDPDYRIVVLLIDERPEEVTHFCRNVQAEVLASSNDQSIESHINLAEMAMAHIRCELECGHDVILLVDSITRMSRAFNLNSNGSRRIMSGGLDSKALEIPRQFFGLARNIENGGSVTVIATVQVGTGSRMDEYIFEEFKSTGNSEIVLDRSLAEARIFPAVDILKSGTRKEELLYKEEEMVGLTALRRRLASLDPKAAMQAMLKLINMTATNKELLEFVQSEL